VWAVLRALELEYYAIPQKYMNGTPCNGLGAISLIIPCKAPDTKPSE
jgi:hypothetical protein